MARISVRALPTQVNRRVRSIPIFVQLVAGLLPTDLSLQVSKSWNQVSLYTVNGAIYYEIISAPAFQYRMFLQVGNVPVEDFAVDLFAPAGSRQATEILFTLIETANPISTSGQYTIGMAPDEPTSISTERVGIFSDDFDANLPADRWTRYANLVGVEVAPTSSAAASLLNLTTPDAASFYQIVRSEIIQGRCHVELRGMFEALRQANSGFAVTIDLLTEKIDAPNQGIIAVNIPVGRILLGFNLRGTGAVFDPQIVADPAGTIRFNAYSEMVGAAVTWGVDSAIVLPGGGLSTLAAEYELDFDGHSVTLSYQGTVLETRLVKIPVVQAKMYTVTIWGKTGAVAPALANALTIDRVDVSNDEHLTSVLISPPGVAPAVVTANQGTPAVDANAWPTKAEGLVQSQPSPNPSAILGTTPTPVQLEPDHALRTRARVLTDEGAFSDDLPGGATGRVLTGNAVFTTGLTAVVGVGTLFTTEVRVGDYVELVADDAPATPRLAQIDSIQDNLHLTLRTAYTGAGGPAGPIGASNYLVLATLGAVIASAGGELTFAPGLNLHAQCEIARAVGAGGRKSCQPLDLGVMAKIDVRQADQEGVMEWYDASLGPTGIRASITFEGLLNTRVHCGIASGATAPYEMTQYFSLPGGRITSDYHYYSVQLRRTGAAFYCDGLLLGTLGVHIPDPYQPMAMVIGMINTTGVAPAAPATLTIHSADYQSTNDEKVQAESMDPERFRATVRDATIFGTGVPRAPENIADNLVHELTLPVGGGGLGMDANKGYCVQQIGGADICIYLAAGAAPAVATVRRGFHVFNGIPWEFIAPEDGVRVWAVKAVDGTADASASLLATNGGNGA